MPKRKPESDGPKGANSKKPKAAPKTKKEGAPEQPKPVQRAKGAAAAALAAQAAAGTLCSEWPV